MAIRATVAWAAVATCCAQAARAETQEADDGNRQPLWLISTRAAPPCGEIADGIQHFCYWQWDGACQWTSRNADGLRNAAEAATPIVVFVHGNRTDADDAVEKGFHAYRIVQQVAGGRPFRCVIWSWPSDREYRRARPDTQQKLFYSDTQSHCLAQWLAALPPQTPVCLVGHSLGPRIIAGALHILAGGEVAGRSLAANSTETGAVERKPVRVVLLAAAMDSDWLMRGRRYGMALSQVEHMLITENGCDRVLRWYPRIYGRCGPDAMGFVGPLLDDASGKVEVVDVSCSVGKIHDVYCYLASDAFRCRLARYAFLDDEPPTDAADKDAEPLDSP